jgi:hypothetical protein
MRLATSVNAIGAHSRVKVFWPKTPNSCVGLSLRRKRWRACCLVGRFGWPRRDTVRDIVLKYPIWQEPYRAAVIETNPKLLKQKIAGAEHAVILRLKQLENNEDHHRPARAITKSASVSSYSCLRLVDAEIRASSKPLKGGACRYRLEERPPGFTFGK